MITSPAKFAAQRKKNSYLNFEKKKKIWKHEKILRAEEY